MAKNNYLLDTNTASYIIKGKSVAVRNKLKAVAMQNIGISAITEAELLFGLKKYAKCSSLTLAVHEFLLRVEIHPFNSVAANSYAELRAICFKSGKSLSAMDLLIASHSIALDSTLVTSDKAFYNLKQHLRLTNWCKAREVLQ